MEREFALAAIADWIASGLEVIRDETLDVAIARAEKQFNIALTEDERVQVRVSTLLIIASGSDQKWAH